VKDVKNRLVEMQGWKRDETMIIHTYIPWILKFVMAALGCGMSHEDS
jgi:hypothetical protein